jgi:23S rRNA (cytidine1920-2'-O)/16S rRNA (cytidine1409-2'-O)-methyltransferase
MRGSRLDLRLCTLRLAESREKAQRLIRAGAVLVNGVVCAKPAQEVQDDAAVEVKAPPRFVSRGGEKLDHAFEAFELRVEGLDCLDVGASTGGFTDCLLQRGAARVIALDVGQGLLDWRLRNDPRVAVREKVNARFLKPDDLPFRPAFASVDVSFISLTKVLPAVIAVLAPASHVVTLIKPQFEAGREQVGKGGVVRDPDVRDAVVETVRRFGVESRGLTCLGVCESPLKGPAGNTEYLAVWCLPSGVREKS